MGEVQPIPGYGGIQELFCRVSVLPRPLDPPGDPGRATKKLRPKACNLPAAVCPELLGLKPGPGNKKIHEELSKRYMLANTPLEVQHIVGLDYYYDYAEQLEVSNIMLELYYTE